MERVIKLLNLQFPDLTYRPGDSFYWSPQRQEIRYVADSIAPSCIWTLLHETSHAILRHNSYESDFELIMLEIKAWEAAKKLAKKMKVKIDENHIEDCLDTYRDWIHARSICPKCESKSLQTDKLHYRCFNCHASWRVTASRFCRSYRVLLSDN